MTRYVFQIECESQEESDELQREWTQYMRVVRGLEYAVIGHTGNDSEARRLIDALKDARNVARTARKQVMRVKEDGE